MKLRDVIHRELSDGVVLAVRVTPKAGADAIGALRELPDGLAALNVRVIQPPDKGKANKAVIALLAKRLGFAKSAVNIVAGDTSRDKQIKIDGQPGDIIEALEGVVCGQGNGDK